MKKIITLLLLAASLTFGSSCSKEKNELQSNPKQEVIGTWRSISDSTYLITFTYDSMYINNSGVNSETDKYTIDSHTLSFTHFVDSNLTVYTNSYYSLLKNDTLYFPPVAVLVKIK